MRKPIRLISVLLMALMLAVIAPISVSAQSLSADSATVSPGMESQLYTLINNHRIANGRGPLAIDPRLTAIARSRSTEMILGDWFSHTRPDGTKVFDTMNAQGIVYYVAGENIGWNNYSDTLSTTVVFNSFVASATHEANQLGSTYNYIGVGVAKGADGKKMYTVLFMEGPDRTRPRDTYYNAVKSGAHQAYLSWGGSDTWSFGTGFYPLATHNAGVASYNIYRRINAQSFVLVATTTATHWTSPVLTNGYNYYWYVRVRDGAGNLGYSPTVMVDY
jgi:uncharacterized protein YkwD